MPKFKMRETAVQDANIRKAIGGSTSFYRYSPSRLAIIAGVSKPTWYRRVQNPESFSVREIRRMIQAYHWDAVTVCSFFGLEVSK